MQNQKLFVRLPALLALTLVVLSSGNALPSTSLAATPPKVKAHIPFDFIVDKQTLPTGDYTIQRVNDHVLVLRDQQNKVVANLNTLDVYAPARLTDGVSAQLRFRRYGTQVFLAAVYDGRDSYGSAIMPSAAERAAAKAERSHLAMKKLVAELITIPAQTGL